MLANARSRRYCEAFAIVTLGHGWRLPLRNRETSSTAAPPTTTARRTTGRASRRYAGSSPLAVAAGPDASDLSAPVVTAVDALDAVKVKVPETGCPSTEVTRHRTV